MSTARRRLGDAADGNIVNPGFGDRPDGLKRHPARSFELDPAFILFDREAELIQAHIIQQQPVRPGLDRVLGLLERVAFDGDADGAGGDVEIPRGGDRRLDAANAGDVVILDQHPVIEPHAVVHRPAEAAGVFGQLAIAGNGFAGVEQAAFGMFDLAHIGAGQGGDARQMLQDIERGAFRRQQFPRIAGDAQNGAAGDDFDAVGGDDLDLRRRIAAFDDFDRKKHAGDDDMLPRHHGGGELQVGGDGRKRRQVAAADILIKGVFDEMTQFFLEQGNIGHPNRPVRISAAGSAPWWGTFPASGRAAPWRRSFLLR